VRNALQLLDAAVICSDGKIIILNGFESDQTIDDTSPDFPRVYELHQNYPNPFNSITQISYFLPKTAALRLAVYDNLGREVMLLREETTEAGLHTTAVDASRLASGVYYYRLTVDQRVYVKKMLLLR
jgi:hypothetical protein